MKYSVVVIFILAFAPLLFSVNVLGEEGEIDKGRVIYLKHCKVCHGLKGKGEGYAHFFPPVGNLSANSIQHKSDKELWESIHMGVPNTAMGMWRFVLSDDEIALVLRYVRSLAY